MKPLSLLFGMPRSGTTWVAKILDSHPLADYRHEPDSLLPIAGAPLLPEPRDAAAERAMLAFSKGVDGIRHVRVCGKQPLFGKEWAGGRAGSVALRANVLVSKVASRFGIGLPLSRFLLSPPGAGHLVWKSIESVGRLGLLARGMPESRAIFLLRHPCAHVSSILRGQEVGKFSAETGPQNDRGLLELLCASSQGQRAGLSVDMLNRMAPEEVLAWRWRIFNDHALEQIGELTNVLTLKYEDVCQDPCT